ncbi:MULTISPECIES: fused response regulator/phosphatase [unclassified Streptomyces]|uniref:fused response regulator/phosphatase n=1 Tax=unclassified Streptomyces TaxID=2593676 RepID=UPI000DBA0CCB|nr:MULTISPECIES: fused response regulator/phosphatase [unclassified Streptomyces]MYT70694.1 SpoIIE family protein phosphatase [Streptomyces sp. SID8367]RAJ90399.1 serine phosphatase RsbU (regulator of sigma subunit) [Streptomyces sp. PsTaAH-137]
MLNATALDPRPGESKSSTVLVVDDTAANRFALSAVLSRAGHLVVPVASAGEALLELEVRLRAGCLPDLALVDVGLPDLSGFELCRRVKALPSLAGIPVVHFSARPSGPVDRCQGLDAGGEAYLTVPAEPEEIRAVVRAALRGARELTDAQAQFTRLALLSEAVVEVQGARCLAELADAAADAAARLTGQPAAVFVLDDDSAAHTGLSRHAERTGLPGAGDEERAAAQVRRVPCARGGIRSAVLPGAQWPGVYVGPGDVRLVLARSRDGLSVCLVTPVHPDASGRIGPLVAQLARATVLAAEPLLRYEQERHVALTLQRSFLPAQLPRMPGLQVAFRYEPASQQAEIGGDFYAALPTPTGVIAAIGDVVGHSLDAATVMVEIRHALRAYSIEDARPGRLVDRIDRMLQHYHPDTTATLCLILVDPGSGRVQVANAGHIPPLILPAHGAPHYAEAAGPLLGLGLPRPEPAELTLAPGDRLLMVTDGLIETRGTDLAVSMDQLRGAAAVAPAGPDALCDTLMSCFGQDRADDIALLALRLSPGVSPAE